MSFVGFNSPIDPMALVRYAVVAASTLVCMDAARAQPGVVSCRTAAAYVERESHLPDGLLLAIGRVETGRPDSVTGRTEPWPWSTNTLGAGHYFPARTDAIAWTDAQFATSGLNIDVGCFQINLRAHPDAFVTLEEAFDPLTNARYAARFLSTLYLQTGNWQEATARYHSADPARGAPYRDQVFARLGERPLPITLAASHVSAVLMDGTRGVSRMHGVEIIVPSWSASPGQWGMPVNTQWGNSTALQWGLSAQTTDWRTTDRRSSAHPIAQATRRRPATDTRMPIVYRGATR